MVSDKPDGKENLPPGEHEVREMKKIRRFLKRVEMRKILLARGDEEEAADRKLIDWEFEAKRRHSGCGKSDEILRLR